MTSVSGEGDNEAEATVVQVSADGIDRPGGRRVPAARRAR